jgi:peptidoglycan-N-acetylglucosamine deacetylase
MIPFRTPFFFPYLYPSLLWRMPLEEKSLYLTFDDGPIPDQTEFVLDALRSRSMAATFFCIGDNVRKHPDVFKQVLKSGHVIGNHTYNHLNGWKTETEKYLKNIEACEEVFQLNCEPHVHINTTLFRPPYGRISYRQIALLNHYKIVMWDVLTHDYNSNISEEKCLRKSIEATRNGSIIVFHDSIKASKNMSFVLPRYIDHFADKGYTFKALRA